MNFRNRIAITKGLTVDKRNIRDRRDRRDRRMKGIRKPGVYLYQSGWRLASCIDIPYHRRAVSLVV